MRRFASSCTFLAAAAWAAVVLGAPVGGPSLLKKLVVDPYSARTFTDTFKGGEKALVVVSGDGKTYMGLYVYDDEGNCVGKDDLGDAGSHDDLAVQWRPARTARYRIEVRNFGALPNVFQIDRR